MLYISISNMLTWGHMSDPYMDMNDRAHSDELLAHS